MRVPRISRAALAVVFTFALTAVAVAQFQRYQPQPQPFAGYPGQQASSNTDLLLRIGSEIISSILGFIVGAIFSPMFRQVRRIAFFILIGLTVICSWIIESPFGDGLSWVISFFAFFVALGYGLMLGVKAWRETQEVPTSFGTAKWATEAYLEARGMFSGNGFMLGAFTGQNRSNGLFYSGPRHLLTVAPTRSGKGVSAIIPNLLNYKGSAFVIDPKGENALITATRRGTGNSSRGITGLGQEVMVVDPWNIAAKQLGLTPACFNPIDWISKDDPDAIENAFLLADALVPPTPGAGESRFWDEEAKALLMGLILYVATSPREAADRHLGRVRDIVLLDEPKFIQLFKDMAAESNATVASTARRTLSKEPKLLSNLLASVQSHTHFLDSPRIRQSLSSSNFRFDDLKTKAVTVYLILPADRLETFGRWLRILIQQAITINARAIDEKPLYPVLFLLDEMPALGRLTMVEQAFGLMAGFGIQLWGIVQDLSQLERIYDKGWQTFISNSGVIQYFGSRDKMTAEYFSTLCGVTTVRIFSITDAISRAISRSVSSGPSGSSSSSGTTTTYSRSIGSNESQRQLAYPDELMVLHESEQIVFVENYDPIRGKKVRWFNDPEMQTLGIDLNQAPRPRIDGRTGPIPPKVVQPPVIPPTPPPERTPQPPVQPPEPPPEREVKRTIQRGDESFVLFTDGSVYLTSPRGNRLFASMDEFEAYMDRSGGSTQ